MRKWIRNDQNAFYEIRYMIKTRCTYARFILTLYVSMHVVIFINIFNEFSRIIALLCYALLSCALTTYYVNNLRLSSVSMHNSHLKIGEWKKRTPVNSTKRKHARDPIQWNKEKWIFLKVFFIDTAIYSIICLVDGINIWWKW